MSKKLLFILVLFWFHLGYGQTNTWTGLTSTDWETGSNWSLGIAPIAIHDVVIPNVANNPIISMVGATCATLTLTNNLAGDNSLIINSSGTLTVTGIIAISSSALDNTTSIIDVNAGILSAGAITMTNGLNDTQDCSLRIGTGTVTVAGDVAMNGSALRNDITFSGAGTLNVGTFISGGTLNASTGLVNYNSFLAQTVGAYVYNNLTLSGGGTKRFLAPKTINNTLFIALGVVVDLGSFTHTVAKLSLDGTNAAIGSWGSTASSATNKNDIYFAATSGIIDVGTSDATLSNLTLSEGILNPVFDPAVTNYTATVPTAIASLTVTPTATNSNAIITVNGIVVDGIIV